MGASAFGAKLQTAGPPVVDIAELTSISGPSISRGSIDVSSHDSTDNLRTFVPAGLADGGEFSVEGNFTNHVTQTALITAFKSTTPVSYIVDYVSPAAVWTFSGLVTAFAIQSPYDGKLGFSATFKVLGKPTLT